MKNKNIWLLPTDKPSRLHLWTDENGTRPALCELEYSHTRNTQNIYITSNEEIKEGDWFISENELFQVESTFHLQRLLKYNYKKIILTTDPELIKYGVQAIDDEFLEWFVKNPSCEDVKIQKDNRLFCKHCNTLHSTFGDGVNCDVCRKESNPYSKTLGYKIIIPKEEPKQERMYSEEDLEVAYFEGKEGLYSFKELLEQFKNK